MSAGPDARYWSRLKPLVKEGQSQVVSVVRHAERADAMFALFNGLPWTRSEDSRRWPLDPPLSDAGEIGALEAAEVIHDFATKRCNAGIDVVVTSPYLRCVQTAATICAKLGPDTRLMIDASLGEVFGPDVFGESRPRNHRRPMQRLLDECKLRGVESALPKIFGAEPVWPENLDGGRQRFAESFLEYQERSCYGCRNFIVVTHGDCVAAATALFPFEAHVRRVEPGGMLLASRPAKKSSEFWLSSVTSRKRWQNSISSPDNPLRGVRSEDDVLSQASSAAAAKHSMGSWSVDSYRIIFEESRTRGAKRIIKNMTRLVASPRMQELLDCFLQRSEHETDEVHDCKLFRNMTARSETCRNFVLNLTSEFMSGQEAACTYDDSQDSAEHNIGQDEAACQDDSQGCLSWVSTDIEAERSWTVSTISGGESDSPENDSEGVERLHGACPYPILQSKSVTDPYPASGHMSMASSNLWQRRLRL
eukprot:TRINITY_DN16635_c0_g1_i1.p1 TRINITY_DN16635_c0_g1~~TRINITY_DN16635_c0_g1_i1.p1  ORF type:complete len:524 (-),score=69.97 TRINITY_DN16635_c0_g1_i1:351-1784(-)